MSTGEPTKGRPDGAPRPVFLHTDVGNAQRLVAAHGADLRYVPRWKVWLVWDGRRWRRDETGEVERRAKQVVRGMMHEAKKIEDKDTRNALAGWALKSEAAGRIKAMVDLARSEPGVAISYTALDQQPRKLAVQNGTLDLWTGQLGPFSRDDLLTKLVDVPFDPEAPCETWERTLSVIFGGDAELIGYVQRAIGYSLTGDTSEQCLHLCHGTGSNGKSTLLDVLAELSGEYGQQADFQTFLDRRHDSGPRNDVARLAGARLVRSSEVGDHKRLNEGLIKSLTGGDVITARFLYSEDFEFKPQFKLWLAANHKPVIRGTDYAIWRRIRLIPFEVTITAEQADRELPKKLRAELPGILAWAVAGCLMWQRDGLRPPERVLAATADYKSESDVIAAFLEDCCELDPSYTESGGKLYTAYKRWADDNGEFVLTNTKFGRDLSDRGYVAKSSFNGKMRHGLRLAHGEALDMWGKRRNAS
jgi:putative DNA primase/helicase